MKSLDKVSSGLCTIALLFSASASHAGLILTLDDLATAGIDKIIVDNEGIGTATPKGNSNTVDLNATEGVVQFAGDVGNFSVNVTTGVSKPLIASSLDLNDISVSSGGGILEIMLTDTDFPFIGSKVEIQNLFGGTTNGTISAQGFLDPDNVAFGTTIETALMGPFGPGVFSGSTIPVIASGLSGPFSLSENIRISHTAGSQVTSFDKELQFAWSVPEPTTLALFGLALAGLGISRRRRN